MLPTFETVFFKAECKCICEDTTYSSSLKQSENSPAFWYFFFGCGGKLLRSRFASGVVMVTGRLPAAEYRGELERDVASDSLVTQYHYHQHQQQHYHHTHCLHSCLRLWSSSSSSSAAAAAPSSSYSLLHSETQDQQCFTISAEWHELIVLQLIHCPH